MLVETLIEEPAWEALRIERLAEEAAVAVLERVGLEPSSYEISLLACSDRRIAELNEDFRGRPQATNVLSWPSAERGASVAGEMPLMPRPARTGRLELGDIALAWQTCAAEAAAEGKQVSDHASHLIVHGVLHLLGFDHERDADAALMEGLEREILGKLGVPDPYGT